MEFTIGGVAYKARKMDAFTQLDIVSLIVKERGAEANPILAMNPEDRKFVMVSCLSLVEREIGPNRWGPIWIREAGRATDPTINDNAFLQLEIVNEVMKGVFSTFFPVSP